MKFNKKYFIIFIFLLLTEIIIAKYITGFIRHTLGDYLVVILLYSFIKSFMKISVKKAALITLVISFIIEFLQLSGLQNMYPSEYSKTLKIVLGTSFSISDLIAYALGVITILVIEKVIKKTNPQS